MRDWWYGDKRDIVKWGALLVLARKRSIAAVLQVALYRPDQPNYKLTIDGGTEPLPIEVVRHFRDIDRIQELSATAKVRVDVHKEVFQNLEPGSRDDFRKSYFDRVAERIKKYNDAVIVFLDPDTGIAPKTYNYKHVTPHEIQTILRAMKPDDVLVFYQAGRLGDGDWLNSTRREFAQAVGPHVPVDTVMCKEIAHDVAFFVVERSHWLDTPVKETQARTKNGTALAPEGLSEKLLMQGQTIVTMPGDGIGNQVLPEALRVLGAVGLDAEYVHADIGWECWRNEGNPLPERTVELLARHKLGLFGAITSKPKKEAAAELKPELCGKGFSYFSPIVSMRQLFNLDICLRPCIGFPGNPLNFIRKRADGGFEEPPVRTVVFRQNTEGLYAGVEWTNPPEKVREALTTHPKFEPFAGVPGEDMAISVRVITRPAARSIIEAAFRYARQHGYQSVTLCEKPNVLRETSGLMEEVAKQVQKHYPEIALWSTNIDAQMMWLTKNPEDYGVVVASNLFGDVISDAFAGLVGGLGFAASGNIGEEVAVFEPTHGSAPKYAELDPPIVNPIAAILAAAMLLDHIGEGEKSKRVWNAVADVVKEGKVRTYDMRRLSGGPKVIEQGAATTPQMTDAIIARLLR